MADSKQNNNRNGAKTEIFQTFNKPMLNRSIAGLYNKQSKTINSFKKAQQTAPEQSTSI